MDFPKSLPDVYLYEGEFTDGTPDGLIPPSRDPAKWNNDVTKTILNVQAWTGEAPNEADLTQMARGIVAKISAMIAAATTSVVIQPATFGPGVTNGKPVRWDAGNNRFALALADGSANDLAIGFADITNAAVYCFGRTRAGLFAGLTPGARYYLTAAGGLSASAAADTIIAGVAVAADTLFVDIDPGSSLANDAYLTVPQLFAKAQGCSPAGVTDAATITPDFTASNNLSMILGGNRTLGMPTGIVAGKSYRLDMWQPQAGNCLLALAWCYQTSNGAGITLSTSGCARDKLFLDVSVYAQSAVTISLATPGEITWPSHNLATGQRVQITTTGALPTGLAAATSYYVIAKDANTLWLASSLTNAASGTKIATSGAQSGVHTMTACTIDVAVKRAFS